MYHRIDSRLDASHQVIIRICSGHLIMKVIRTHRVEHQIIERGCVRITIPCFELAGPARPYVAAGRKRHLCGIDAVQISEIDAQKTVQEYPRGYWPEPNSTSPPYGLLVHEFRSPGVAAATEAPTILQIMNAAVSVRGTEVLSG